MTKITGGGRYVLTGGKLERVEDPTRPHEQGDAPRDARGFRLDRPTSTSSGAAAPPAPRPAAADPAPVTKTTTRKKGGGDAA